MAANTTFVSGAILTAAQMNALPWGIVDATAGGTSGRGFKNSSAGNFSLTSTLTDVTDMTVTFTPVTGRIYRATFSARGVNASGTAQTIVTKITDGSNVVKNANVVFLDGSNNAIVYISAILTGLSGSTTLKVRAQVGTSTGLFINDAETFFNFTVEDIGPSA